MPPNKLAISTASVSRLVAEERSYHTELASQEAAAQRIQARITAASTSAQAGAEDDENAEYELRQQRKAADETRKVIPEVRRRVQTAVEGLEELLEKLDGSATAEEQSAAEDAIAKAKAMLADGKA